MKKIIFLAASLILTACAAPTPTPAPAFHNLPPSAAPSTQTAPPVWQARLSAPVNASPMLSGDFVIVPTADGQIHAVRAADGSAAWTFSELKAWDASVNADESKVCAGAQGKQIFCLDAQSGKLIWSAALEFEVQSRLALTGERIYAPATLAGEGMQTNFAGRVPLIALDSATGQILWQAQTENYILRRPAVYGDLILTGGAYQLPDKPAGEVGTAVYAFNADGLLVWEYKSNDGLMRWVETDGERAYFSAATETIYALNLTDGKKIWESAPGYWMQFPALQDGQIFFGSGDEVFHSLDAASGKEIWSSAINPLSLNQIGRPLLRGDKIWFHAVTGEIYAFNARSGEQMAYIKTGHSARVGGVVFDALYILGDSEGNVYAYSIP
ncbi:MAG: hypothetical protein Fur002_01890 [Anaerolineales bacterium]